MNGRPKETKTLRALQSLQLTMAALQEPTKDRDVQKVSIAESARKLGRHTEGNHL